MSRVFRISTHRRWLIVGLAVIGWLYALVAPAQESDAAWRTSGQMVLVIIPDWNANHGVLRAYQRENGIWRSVAGTQAVIIGSKGAAWGLGLHQAQSNGPQKREGDNRSAAGVFRIGEAFGYADTADTRLSYRVLHASDYCIDVSNSPYYNRIMDVRKLAGQKTGEQNIEEQNIGGQTMADSGEPMRRDIYFQGDMQYKIGFIIQHNRQGQPGAGSCIFAHVWRSPTSATVGCTAMPEAAIRGLLAWLNPAENPVFVLLPQAEYTRLRAVWHLPII